MNRIILLVLFVFSYCVGTSQSISQRSQPVITVQDGRLFAQYNFRPPVFADTIQANLQIGLDSCGALIFSRDINSYYLRACSPKRWVTISGGSSIDTTSLSNRINLKIDSLKRSSDSVFAYRNGTRVFQFKDSVGTTPTLQQVTNAGSTTTNTISVAALDLGIGNSLSFNRTGSDLLSITNSTTGDNLLEVNNSPTGGLIIGGGTYPYLEIQKNPFANVLLNAPSTSGIIPISVNGYTANLAGAITIPTGGVAVDTIFRTLGKDSIFYKKNNITYAIKDSVGSGGSSTDTTSLSNRINSKLSISDTASMLSPYFNKVNYGLSKSGQNISVDTSVLSNKYLRIVDTTNKFVNTITRTVGKDSIIYFIGGTRYAIKDSVGTNPPASGYYGAFQDNTSQTAASINTAYAVKLNTTDLTNGVSVVNDGSSNPTRVTLANTGIYNIQFSLQLEKTGGSGNMIADIWIRKNGVDIPSTTGKVVLTGSANASPVIAAWNYVLDLTAGDYIQLMWATSNTNVEIVAAVATSPHPAIPSAILTVTQQAGILAGTGITAINSLTGAAQTVTTGTSGTDFAVSSTGTTHTLNLPTASATNRGALSTTDWSTFNSKLGASDTVSLSNRINLKLNSADTASLSNRINLKLNATDTASISNRINQTPTLTGYQLLGSTIKSFPLGVQGFTNATATLNHVSTRMLLVAIYIPQTTTITGVKYIVTGTGTLFVGNSNYNGFVLYSYNVSTGLATRVDSTANDNTIWTTTGIQSKAFVTPISLSPGIYYLSSLCQGTATTFPSVAQNTSILGQTSYDFTSPARLSGYITVTSSPSSFNLSTSTLNTNLPIYMLY